VCVSVVACSCARLYVFIYTESDVYTYIYMHAFFVCMYVCTHVLLSNAYI
jgi:hypothetical protein